MSTIVIGRNTFGVYNDIFSWELKEQLGTYVLVKFFSSQTEIQTDLHTKYQGKIFSVIQIPTVFKNSTFLDNIHLVINIILQFTIYPNGYIIENIQKLFTNNNLG